MNESNDPLKEQAEFDVAADSAPQRDAIDNGNDGEKDASEQAQKRERDEEEERDRNAKKKKDPSLRALAGHDIAQALSQVFLDWSEKKLAKAQGKAAAKAGEGKQEAESPELTANGMLKNPPRNPNRPVSDTEEVAGVKIQNEEHKLSHSLVPRAPSRSRSRSR